MFKYLQYFFSLAKTFSNALPLNMLVMVVLGLFSRVSSMLALLLPVKILILVGSNRVPRYFPEFLREIPQEALIQILCAATIILYATYVGLEKISSSLERRAEKLLASQLNCQSSDARTVKLLRKTYRRVSGNLTELCFMVAVLLFIIVVYPALLLLLLMYTAIVLAGYELFSNFGRKEDVANEVYDENGGDEDEDNGLIDLWVEVGFLVSFFFVVLGMLSDWGPGLIIAFICFLLLRRSSGGIKRFLKNLVVIYAKQSVLSSLLESTSTIASSEDIKNELPGDDVARSIIITVLCEGFPGAVLDESSVTKFDQGDKSIDAYVFDIDLLGKQRQLLIKMFLGKKQRARAEFKLFSGLSRQSFKGTASCGRCQDVAWLLIDFAK